MPAEPTMNRGIEMWIPTPDSWGRGNGLEIESITHSQLINQSCLCSEASIKTQKNGKDLESFQTGERVYI